MTVEQVAHPVNPRFSWERAIAHSDLAPTTRLVAFAIALHQNRLDDVVWPSQARLASETGLSRQSVNTHIRVLETRGFITKTARDGRSALYSLTVPDVKEVDTLELVAQETPVKEDDRGVSKRLTGGVKDVDTEQRKEQTKGTEPLPVSPSSMTGEVFAAFIEWLGPPEPIVAGRWGAIAKRMALSGIAGEEVLRRSRNFDTYFDIKDPSMLMKWWSLCDRPRDVARRNGRVDWDRLAEEMRT